MKTSKSPLGLKTIKGGALLAMAISSVMMSVNTYATSAGTVLRNTVTVSYDDTGGTAQTPVDASVDVTVDMVPSVAWGMAPGDQTIGSATELPTAYTLTLTNTGNGSDTYTIADNTVESCTGTATLDPEGFSPTPSPLTLGATVASGTATFNVGTNDTSIPVSNIVAADFTAGDLLVIGANTYEVKSVTSDGDPLTPDELIVEQGVNGSGSDDATGDVAGAGTQIGEQATISYAGPLGGLSGVLTAGGAGDVCEHQHELTANGSLATGGNADVSESTGADYFTTLVRGVTLTVAKYVRNVTDGTKNSGGGVSLYGQTYYASGVTGNPTDELEYLVITTNTSSADADNVVFSDTLPLYTTYVTSSLVVDADGAGGFDAPIVGDTEVDVAAGGVIGVSGGVITVYAGVGGLEDGAGAGGSVQDVGEAANTPSNTTAIRYSVTID